MANKKEQLAQEVAKAVGAGKLVALDTVDFSDPNRPKTCLEVDFPILPVNQVAVIQGNDMPPIYSMQKWWAWRRASIFRAMLLAAATPAPADPSHAAKKVWDVYYGNHQKKGALSHLKVLDPFMGSGTTLIEGSRLGLQMIGNDLSPVAWFKAKHAFSKVSKEDVTRLLEAIEAEVRPQIIPYYCCDGPNGERGTWTHVASKRVMPPDFDPLILTPDERREYHYEGPEVIYTFWAKHGPCQVTGCGHRTPIMTSPVMAVKTLTVKHWEHTCGKCGGEFHVEEDAARMAPDVPLFVAPSEYPFSVLDRRKGVVCPHCGHAAIVNLGKGTNKKIELSLLVHPQWQQGSPKQDVQGRPYGGSAQDDAESSARWNDARAAAIRLLEVRGVLPEEVTCPKTNVTFRTDAGTVPKKSTFACGACGTAQDVLASIKATAKTGPMAGYAVQAYAPRRDASGACYGGRFFAPFNQRQARQYNAALAEWEARKDTDLADYWPRSEVPYGFMTHMNNGGIPNHGFTHWWTMFSPRQLLVHALLLKAIVNVGEFDWSVREYVVGAFQQYLRNQNSFCIWDISRDGLAPHLSNNNYHPKSTVIENCVFATLGRGNWVSCAEGLIEGRDWSLDPGEPVSMSGLRTRAPQVAALATTASAKVFPGDAVGDATVLQGSSTELTQISSGSLDLVITDPPFGGLLHYSELADFFHVWLRLALKDKYLRAFFGAGERRVPLASVRRDRSRTERVLLNVEGTEERARKAWLSFEAHVLPVMESASALTSAKIDLLPHQVVLTHRVATASPRRYLVADEVGLGKTIETALILRELASRGELDRALMVVPAGLVNNWHRELNEVFNLGFEVFGSEGDITDRKTNAFAKHDRLIASIDTLKRPARIKRLLDAPRWDLVVFDEAHHLTAYRTGGKVRKTENYKLAEALKDQSRDLLLLSATPHQGNHFQFWMLVQLLNPTLFGSPEDMVENRHRLNTVMFRRTKADACQPDGSPLFARRWVHTESFVMGGEERLFYERLREYLEDGFDLARRQGNQGRALGFLMAIFQKIAASSFAAVRRTLKRRLLMLTLHEALLRDKELDIEARERLIEEARELIHESLALAHDSIGRSEVDRVLADLKYRLVKRLDEEALEMASDPYASEFSAIHAEEAASAVVDLHLPEERLRIGDLLKAFPSLRETKCQKLLDGLGTLWRQNANEKIVVFATYLGTVELIAHEIEQAFPGQGVAVLRGGDHGAKLAAERRFRQKDGPRVLVCTAAGREGINLQFARVLFNFDLPWNPMDVEQRIGRIHRYGQRDTAQVYNLVLSDTIEGRIFLLLDDKLTEIARAVGKVDEQGNVAEDLRAQVLGQLSERLNYDRLYQEALSDPELKRTQVELEAALTNSREARQVVFDLFQDLEGFSLDDYKPFSDVSSSLDRLARFMTAAVADRQQRMVLVDQATYDFLSADGSRVARFTLDRDAATGQDGLELLGLDHSLVQEELGRWRATPPEEIGIAVVGDVAAPVLLSLWMVEASTGDGGRRVVVQPIAINLDGARCPTVERQFEQYLHGPAASATVAPERRLELFASVVEATLQRELKHKGAADGGSSYSAELIGYVEVIPRAA